MKMPTMSGYLAVFCLIGNLGLADGLPMGCPPGPMAITELESLAGQPVDISPWTYTWRSDRAVQEQPEAYFIPRRLERIDTVYRTAIDALPEQELKSIYYEQPDMLKRLPPKPEWPLQAGLLWTGGVVDCRVELAWPADAAGIPAPDRVEVRVYPTSWGWFGWTVDRILSNPEVSADGRTWVYRIEPGLKMDYAYSRQVDAATEMVAVFYEGDPSGNKTVIPNIRVTGSNVGVWKRIDVEIEWGFQAGTETSDIDGRLETHAAMIGQAAALTGDQGTTVTGDNQWKSHSVETTRRGIILPVLYAPDSRPGLDSRITVWMRERGFTFRIKDLENDSILIPAYGVFITRSGSGQTARQYAGALAAKRLKSIRQLTREHGETASCEEVMTEVRTWTCPEGTVWAPFPQVEDPVMEVLLPDPGWTNAWRAAADQLRGKHMWGGLAYEVGRVAHAMDMIGLHEESDKIYDHFLKSPGVKPDGDFTDGSGALEWAASMRHDMGYSHDGTHASTGRMLFAMAERYLLTGDTEWFERNRPRLQAAADWIIRQRKLYMMNIPNRQDLFVAGLMPPYMLGDYALPACDWHWYYSDNALSLQAVQRFADALSAFDAEAGARYHAEAEAFRNDIRRVVEQDAALSPVRPGRDGMYHSFVPRMAYARGMTGLELGAPQYSDSECDSYIGALPLAEPFGALDANEPVMMDTLDIMTEMTASESAVRALEEQRKAKNLAAEEAWYWMSYVSLPKASHNANIFLMQDDVPNFLRFLMNSYATMAGADGKLWEHWHLGNCGNCEAPDNGTAGWFMENFRNMLVMEEGGSLWVARAVPRAWLEQGKTITVRNAPTYFGQFAYEIVSDADNGTIAASLEAPSRNAPQNVFLRLRHPKSMPVKSATVNGQAWTDFDSAKEMIRLHDIHGSVKVVAAY